MTHVVSSDRSTGKKYIDAIRDPHSGILKWHNREQIPEYIRDTVISKLDDINPKDFDLIFTAVESDAAQIIEPKLATEFPLLGTAAAFRYENDVPILIPGINDDHIELLNKQKKERKWGGFIAPLPNCTTTGLAITLKPIMANFGIKSVLMTSMQALSGAGRSPGVVALDILDNVIPYIPKEEEKVQIETKKILGRYSDLSGEIISDETQSQLAPGTRVPVSDGHTEVVFVETSTNADPESVAKQMVKFSENVSIKALPSAPKDYIIVNDDPTRPQPRIDREVNDGMTTVVGRLRKDSVFENGIKYVLLTHNEKMGSAKGAVLLAELLKTKNII